MSTEHKLNIQGSPREWFVHPLVEITVKALAGLKIKPAAKWKYRCPWNDNGGENLYPISYSSLLELIRNETRRTEEERSARKKNRSKMVFYSAFYVYTRSDGPGSPLAFAFYFSRENYRKNKAGEIKTKRNKKYEKPHLIYTRKHVPWRFDEEAYWQRIKDENDAIKKTFHKDTPLERAEKRWKNPVHQEIFYAGVNTPALVYSRPKQEKVSFEQDLNKTIKKNAEEAEKRKWKHPPEGYQIGMSDPETKEYFRGLFKNFNHEEISSALEKEGHIQTDIPSWFVPRTFEAVQKDSSLKFNIYKKNRDGYPAVKYCFPRKNEEERTGTEKEAVLITLRR